MQVIVHDRLFDVVKDEIKMYFPWNAIKAKVYWLIWSTRDKYPKLDALDRRGSYEALDQ